LTPEGRFLLYFIGENKAVEWDGVAAREARSWHPIGGLSAYAFTTDGRWRITLGRGGVGTLLDAATGRQTPLDLGARELTDACFSPNGSLLAIASELGFVKIWKRADLAGAGKAPEGVMLGGFTAPVVSVAFSPDG